MRKSGTSARCTQMFGVPLEEVALTHTHAGYEVPLLVQHIVEYLHGRLDSEGVFLVNGNAERVDWLRQRYDSGEKVVLEKEADLASAVSLLRLFLQELPEPLITMEIQTHLLHIHQDYSSDEDICRNMKFVLQQLPQLSYNLLRFLCGFLARVASVQDDRWTVGSLASVFGPDLFHLWTEGEDIRDQEKVSRVLAELLDNQDGLFDSDDSDDDDDDDEDASSTNDYSSFNEQEDERGGGGGEELPQDSEGMCEAAHQHTGESTQGCHGDEGGTEPEGSACGLDGETQLSQKEEYQHYLQDVESSCAALGDNSAMELDLLEAFSSDSQSFDSMDYTDMVSFGSSDCDQNANRTLLPCQPEIGHAAALHLFPGNQFEDPVPAYKSWQDDSDQGEAQLSPLAGRMLPLPALPLEEEAGDTSSSSSSSSSHHLLARRFLDFGAHGTRRFLLHEPDMFSKTHRPRRASFGSKEAMRGGDSATHQLTKKLQHLKKKMKQFEEQFERERNYKPSHGDKAANPKVLKWMTDLTKLRRQIKDARHRAESDPQTRPRSNTLPKSFGSTLDHDAPGEVKVHRPSREETLDLIQRRLGGKRQEDDWPEDIKKMTKEQLCCEKTVLQKNLLYYEGLHGRPVTKGERLVVRPLYDRYRLVKQMLTRITIAPVIVSPSSKRRGQILQPIIEGETAHFYDDVEEELRSEEDRGGSEVIMTLDPAPLTDRPITEQNNLLEEVSGKLEHRLSSCHASSMPELLEQLWKSRAEKKRLRQSIREFEEDFYQKYSRRVQKEERAALLDEYREYKRIKAKLRLLEVLISKQDSSKSI